MSELIVTFSFVSLFVSLGVLWFVVEMMRRMMADNKRYIDERFTSLLANIREVEDSYKKIDIACRELNDDIEAVKVSQKHSAGKEQAITASLKEVSKQIHTLDSQHKKATGTDG